MQPQIRTLEQQVSRRQFAACFLPTVENKAGSVEQLLQRRVNFSDQNFLIPLYREGRLPVRPRHRVGGAPLAADEKQCFSSGCPATVHL